MTPTVFESPISLIDILPLPLLLTVNAVSWVVPPTVPVNVIAPVPDNNVKSWPPSTVPCIFIDPLEPTVSIVMLLVEISIGPSAVNEPSMSTLPFITIFPSWALPIITVPIWLALPIDPTVVVPAPASKVTVSVLSPIIAPVIVMSPAPLPVSTEKSESLSRSTLLSNLIESADVMNDVSDPAFKSISWPEAVVIVVAPLKLYKVPKRLISFVVVPPILVIPAIPGWESLPMLFKKSIFPVPAVVALTSKPPNSLVAPTVPENVTKPEPELITKLSLSPPSDSSFIVVVEDPKLTAPPPVVIVVAASLCNITSEVPKLTAAFEVVIAKALLPPITILFPPVVAV